ncbi:MAG: NAD(P)-dependent oxidoreductase [Sphingomonadaceae bacterium]|nr:NAD(P)-dependent oxidoreductase [Sphingomonadaceae bacterium]
MSRLLIFGLGYTAVRIAARLRSAGWRVDATGSAGNIVFEDAGTVLAEATHVLSSVPPGGDVDPVLDRYGGALGGKWLGYLSSTGVYGDAGGAWIDESAPLNGRRGGRITAELAWQALGARAFRLPGIYGPGRSALDRVLEGKAHRVDLPGQIFSRVHVDDIASGVIAGLGAPPGVYNLADDRPASQNTVIETACALLGVAPPSFVALESLSVASRAFYGENRRVANGKAKRLLGWRPAYPDFAAGLGALIPPASPASASTPPAAASSDQR